MQELKIKSECPRCHEIWTLTPSKWRNLESITRTGKKTVICPFCNKKLHLNKKQTLELLKEKMRYNENKFSNVLDRERKRSNL